MARVAWIVPITNPNRFGYHWTFMVCIESLLRCGDVYLVCSDPVWPGSHFVDEKRNVLWGGCTFISRPDTWYPDDVFSMDRYLSNIRLGMEQARADGHKIAINASCNWYVPEAAIPELQTWWDYILLEKLETDSLFVRYQLGDRLMGASAKHESVINLTVPSSWQFTATDGVVNSQGREVCTRRGDWSLYNHEAIVDCNMECTLADYTAKMNYVRCYQDLAPYRDPVFNWEQWKGYSVNKVRAMPVSSDPLPIEGRRIAEQEHPPFISELIAKELQ